MMVGKASEAFILMTDRIMKDAVQYDYYFTNPCVFKNM